MLHTLTPKFADRISSYYAKADIKLYSSRTELIVIVTSLIGSGSELLKPMFQNAPNWNYFETSSNDPIFNIYGKLQHKESWEETEEAPELVRGWLESMLGKAATVF